MKTNFVNRLSVPMRKEDNDALSEVRAALEKITGVRLSNSETVRRLIELQRNSMAARSAMKNNVETAK